MCPAPRVHTKHSVMFVKEVNEIVIGIEALCKEQPAHPSKEKILMKQDFFSL